jgi:hypothetical protein
MVERAVVGKKEQAFTVVIEPPRCVDLRREAEPCERGPALVVGEFAVDEVRLVERDQHYASVLYTF